METPNGEPTISALTHTQIFSNLMVHINATPKHVQHQFLKTLLLSTPADIVHGAMKKLPTPPSKPIYPNEYKYPHAFGESIRSRQTMISFVMHVMIPCPAMYSTGQVWFVIWCCFVYFPNWFIDGDTHVLDPAKCDLELPFTIAEIPHIRRVLDCGFTLIREGKTCKDLLNMPLSKILQAEPSGQTTIGRVLSLPAQSLSELKKRIDYYMMLGHGEEVIWIYVHNIIMSDPDILNDNELTS